MNSAIQDLQKSINIAGEYSEKLTKSHVSGYTKKDGTVVQEHEDSRSKKIITNNEGYGYHGEAYMAPREHGMGEHSSSIADEHFHEAAKAVMKHGNVDATDARNYLDSAFGRHLHDEVRNRAWRNEERPLDIDKGHHHDIIKRHIEPAIKEHFQQKYAKKDMEKIKANRAAFE